MKVLGIGKVSKLHTPFNSADYLLLLGSASCFLMSHPDATCSAQNQPNMILSKQGVDNGVEVSRSNGIVR